MTDEHTEEKNTPKAAEEKAAPVVAPAEAATAPAASPAPAAAAPRDSRRAGPKDGPGGDRRQKRRVGRGREDRARSEFDQKIISLRRVARVVAGGRRFSFSAAMVAGDRKGRVGIGLGKGIDTALAMEKALRDAKKNMITVKLTPSKSIAHDIETKYASSHVAIRPAPDRGIVAGSSIRTVLELAGVTDVTAKIHSRSRNKLNNARAAIQALEQLQGK